MLANPRTAPVHSASMPQLVTPSAAVHASYLTSLEPNATPSARELVSRGARSGPLHPHCQDLFAVSDLTMALDALIAAHRRLGSPAGDFLRAGLPADAVVARLAELGLPAPPDVVELYRWADGSDEAAWQADASQAPFLRFAGDTSFPPLDDAARWCRTVREMAQTSAYDSMEGLTPDAFWHPTWFPVLRRDRGEVAVACLEGEPATVHEVSWDRPDEQGTFTSLTQFILAATIELRDRFVWLSDDRVLLRREVAELRRSTRASRP